MHSLTSTHGALEEEDLRTDTEVRASLSCDYYFANLSVNADIENYEEDEGDDAVGDEVQVEIYFDVERVQSKSSWSYFLNLEGFQYYRCIPYQLKIPGSNLLSHHLVNHHYEYKHPVPHHS